MKHYTCLHNDDKMPIGGHGMKFLVCTGSVQETQTLVNGNFSASDFGVLSKKPYFAQLGKLCVVSSVTPGSNPARSNAILLWDGAPISDEGAFSPLFNSAKANAPLERYLQTLESGKVSTQLSGIFGTARFSAGGDGLLAPDPLSQYAFFLAKVGGQTLVSNSLHLIERAGTLLGQPFRRAFASNAYEAAFGIGGWTHTGLEGVEKILPDHYLVFSNGTVTQRRFPSSLFASKFEPGTYTEKYTKAKQSLLQRMAGISRSFPDEGMVLDLSGGQDTRLLLGTLLANKSKNFHVFAGGGSDSRDRHVANMLINHFGLKSGAYLSNLGSEEALSAFESGARATYRSMGTSSLFHSTLGKQQLVDVAQVRGGSAEGRTKAFFRQTSWKKSTRQRRYVRQLRGSRPLLGNFDDIFQRIVSGDKNRLQSLLALVMARGKRHHDLFTSEFLHEASLFIENNMEWMLNAGVHSANLADAFYMFDRGWRHCGLPSQIMNDARPTFEPLNDVQLASAQFSLEQADRDRARLSRDLMQSFDVDGLLEFPFADTNWPEAHFTDDQHKKRAALADVSSTPIPAEKLIAPTGKADGVHARGAKAYMQAVMPSMRAIASDLPTHHVCWDYLKRDHFLESLANGRLEQPQTAGTGARLFSSLLWITGQEERVAIEDSTK